MEIFNDSRPKQVVYVQMRQVVRGRDGKLKIVKTKTVTIHNVTIEQVRAILEKGGTNRGPNFS